MKQFFKQEPAIIVGALTSALAPLAAFGLDIFSPEQAAAIVGFVSATAVLIRGLVYSPESAETLAKGTLQSRPTPRQAAKAKTVLGIDPSGGTVIPPELKRLAEQYAHLLPFPYASIVAEGGLVALEIALKTAQNAARRPTTWDESKDVIKDLGKGL